VDTIILASQSPRRAELLAQAGIRYFAAPASIDEAQLPDEDATAYVKRIATAKARAVHRAYPDRPVLGADTAVVLDRRILGKPADRAEGVRMLLALAGRTHEVLTGVAVLAAGHMHYRLSSSRVRLRHIGQREATAYWATGEPADKAGGYAVQGRAAAFIENIEGSYSGIVGLPLFETLQILNAVGVHADWDV
jgi:septum formation protein